MKMFATVLPYGMLVKLKSGIHYILLVPLIFSQFSNHIWHCIAVSQSFNKCMMITAQHQFS